MKIACALFLASATNGKILNKKQSPSFCRSKTTRAESLQNSVKDRMGDRHVLRRKVPKMERRNESQNQESRPQVHFSVIFALEKRFFKTCG